MHVCLDKDVALSKLLSIFIKNVLRNSKLKRGIRRFRNKKNENKDLSAVAHEAVAPFIEFEDLKSWEFNSSKFQSR